VTAGKVWFVTGASRGFGRQWTTAALERGDRVAATARDPTTLEDLVGRFGKAVVALRLDVTDRATVFGAVKQAHQIFGRLDVVVNNAGYAQLGAVEELSETDLRAQMETNFFGPCWVAQASLPLLRAQGGGHLIQVSSVVGVAPFRGAASYNASKAALEGFSEALAAEVRSFGIWVTIVEPGSYNTGRSASVRVAPRHPAYESFHQASDADRRGRDIGAGDPAATATAILRVVDAAEPPLRIFLGAGNLQLVRRTYEGRLATWAEWDPVASAAQGT
jgi:NAD(P)-dependent dehydrogenase (short-subunit alcohol dehydrogenase family)